jgi:hypothetical protein
MDCENCQIRKMNDLKIGNLQHEVAKAKEAVVREKVARRIEAAAIKAGASVTALTDIQGRAEAAGRWVDDPKRGLHLVNEVGIAEIDDVGNWVSPERLVGMLGKDTSAGHLFQANGAPSPQGSASGTNPFVKGPHFNMTEQGRLLRQNPTLAKQMAAAAGVKLDI